MPRRRCVGCGRIAPKSELVRLAVAREAGGRPRYAVVDRAGTLPGRGAYLCRANGGAEDRPGASAPPVGRAALQSDSAPCSAPHPDCLRLAERRRGIPRALRCAVTLAPEFVESVDR